MVSISMPSFEPFHIDNSVCCIMHKLQTLLDSFFPNLVEVGESLPDLRHERLGAAAWQDSL